MVSASGRLHITLWREPAANDIVVAALKSISMLLTQLTCCCMLVPLTPGWLLLMVAAAAAVVVVVVVVVQNSAIGVVTHRQTPPWISLANLTLRCFLFSAGCPSVSSSASCCTTLHLLLLLVCSCRWPTKCAMPFLVP